MSTVQVDDDVAQLHKLGYAQELRRRMGGFSNFAVSFTIISVLSGCLTLYYFGMTYGGPVVIVWGWIIVGLFTTIVGLGMAEIASAYPTAGGLYYWSAKLSESNSAAWSWFTGWFNLLGQVAVTAGIDFGFATFFTVFLNLTTNFPDHHRLDPDRVRLRPRRPRAPQQLRGADRRLPLRRQRLVAHPRRAHHRRGALLRPEPPRLGLLRLHEVREPVDARCALVRLHDRAPDGAVHLHRLRRLGPHVRGDPQRRHRGAEGDRQLHRHLADRRLDPDPRHHVRDPDRPQGLRRDFGPTQRRPCRIWETALSRVGAELLLLIAVVAQFFCGMASAAANSRMLFAFSRDGAVPGHRYWHRINPRTRTPTNSIWFCVVFAFLLAVPVLWSSVAYAAVTSIATIGLYIAYVLPTLLRRIKGKSWEGGRWSLGKWSPLVGWVGILWVAFIAVLFMLPEVSFSTINRDNFNYAPMAVGVVLLFSGGYWLLSARKWFKGPKTQGDEAQLQKIEAEFSNIERELEEVD